jgi:hypothetical protein
LWLGGNVISVLLDLEPTSVFHEIRNFYPG